MTPLGKEMLKKLGRIDSIKILKYTLEVVDEQTIEIPGHGSAEVLCVQVQSGKICIWVKVNMTAENTGRRFWVIGTGHPWPAEALCSRYIGTVQLKGGALVFHVFEETDE